MTLVARFADLAASLIAPSGLTGFVCTFRREVPSGYDPIAGVVAPNVVTTWPGAAIWAKAQPTRAVAGETAQRQTTRALLVPGRSVSVAPMPGDTLTVAGVPYTVADVTHLGDADATTPPLYRLTVRA